ncbi:Putative O-methyltransferase/MSMEI_4947 [Fusobacterium nucleatum]|uniref:O-methyltransferase n=1 Tax=Fusobacterium nucleatum TaxID=851 RepID=UPI00195F0C2B|nr:O-methyltransferase [Fusobacterium nucleatum]VTX59349.1 Putative O-methyltransferase/MSMEI_4947 [Fusobacterium nucleatum]
MLEELKEANEYISSKIDKYRSTNLLIKEIEKDAEINNVPIISKEIREYLKFIIRTNKNIKNILEVGTATGYSGIIMSEEIQDRNGSLTTIEIDEDRFKIAQSNFEKSNLKRVEQIFGDATEEIEKLDKNFDFIFIDAAKGQYKKFFEDSYKLLNEGGIVFIDNILFRGYLYKESPKRFKTIVKRLDEFIDYLYENFDFILLPISDGVGLVYKQIKNPIKFVQKI